jgi:hypothetical protein
MAQDRLSTWDEDGEVRGFDNVDNLDNFGSEDRYDVDIDDDNPNLWEADLDGIAAGPGELPATGWRFRSSTLRPGSVSASSR